MASITSVASSVLNASINTSSLSTPRATSSGSVQQVAAAVGQALHTSSTSSLGKAGDHFMAASTDSRLRATQAQQLHEIAAGVRSGSLGAKDAEMLLKAQQDVFTKRSSAMADGKMTAKETIELQLVQQNVQTMIDTLVQNGSGKISSVSGLAPAARQQATQLDKLANGLSQGTITPAETGKLLQQQTDIADKRGDADSASENAAVNAQLTQAGKDIDRHSQQGTQLDFVSAIKLGALVKG